MIKRIEINERDLKSIKRAEKTKTRLENDGYTLIETVGGINTSILIYSK